VSSLSTAATRAKRRAAVALERPRRGARRTLMATIRQIPHYLRLLGGLLTDRRVSTLDKVLVGAAIAYVVSPLDLVPDAIPFLGQVDDIFLVTTALQRLVTNAGRHVLLDHWAGDRAELSELNIERVVSAAAFFLPLGLRRKLRRIGRR
jgi:uncharacterized membrane protein YkvA (DUF1232 family)